MQAPQLTLRLCSRPMELDALDLNLLRVFDHLMRERRVARVAEQLGVTQPAVSNALAKLRRHLEDELFVRGPQGMVPTPCAERLAGPVAQALALLHAGLSDACRGDFDPSRSRQAITLGMTDIGEIYFLPRLLAHLAQVAPGMTLSTVRHTAVNLKDALEAGTVDLALGWLPQLQAGFFQRRLFSQRHVCLMRRGHPLDSGPDAPPPGQALTLDAYQRADHLAVVSAGTGHGLLDEQIRREGIARPVRLTVPHFVSVGHILQHSDLLATLPERLAEALAGPFALVARPCPVPLPEVPIHVFWHAKAHRDPLNQWLRAEVSALFGQG